MLEMKYSSATESCHIETGIGLYVLERCTLSQKLGTGPCLTEYESG